MKLKIISDIQEISDSARVAFFSTFHYQIEESADSDQFDADSDDSDFDLEPFGCGEITPQVEEWVENTWEICHPIDEVFGPTTAGLIQDAVLHPKKETNCVSLNVLGKLLPGEGEERDLINTCIGVAYWCCCETLENSSPIIAAATSNLFY